MHDPTRFSLQAALMTLSLWVLGGLLLGASYALVGVGGIVVLLVSLVVARVVAGIFGDRL